MNIATLGNTKRKLACNNTLTKKKKIMHSLCAFIAGQTNYELNYDY